MARAHRFLYWAPRIIGLVFVGFLMLFSLDVFDMVLGFWQTVLGLFMHNIPALVLLAVVIISWKHELVGAVVFPLAGIAYIILTMHSGIAWYLAFSRSLIIAVPAFLVGLLFYLNWRRKRRA